MPWCEGCSRFLNPNTLRADGTCPKCGRKVADPDETAATRRGEKPDEASGAAPVKAPWHFKLLVAATVVYLGWRLVQGADWVIERILG